MKVIYSWDFFIQPGYNLLNLQEIVILPQGSFVVLTQITGTVGIDTTGDTSYSDLIEKDGAFYQLNPLKNWKFYFNALTSFSSYLSSINIVHTYANMGSYNINMIFLNGKTNMSYLVYITHGKYK